MFRKAFGAAVQAAALVSGVIAGPALAADVACSLPGELASEDAAGDAVLVAAPDPLPGHDVLSVHVAEPAPDRFALTLTVDGAPVATPNTVYYAYFMGDDGVPRYASYDPYPGPGESAFQYGHTEPGPGGVGQLTRDGDADATSTADAASGVITIVLPRERVLGESTELSGVYGDARALIGVLGSGLVTPVDSSPEGFYLIRGDACAKSGSLKSSAGLAMGGSLGLGLLAPLALLGLRRRSVLALVLAAGSPAALAADPASGTVSPEAPELTYTFPIAPVANVSGLTGLATSTEAYECTEPEFPCDEFELTLALPADFMTRFPDALVRVSAATSEPNLDIDLQIADASGEVKYITRDNPPEQPSARIIPAGGTEKFTVQVTHGTPHTGGSVTVRLEPGDAVKSSSTAVLGGGTGFGLLGGLAGLAMLRRRGTRAALVTLLGVAAPTLFAAEPAAGTLTESSGPLQYTAGPFLVPNPTPQLSIANVEAVCEPDTQSCDIYSLTVTLPDSYADEHPDDSILIVTSWEALPGSAETGVPDFDVYLHSADGTLVADAATGDNPERIRVPVFGGTRQFEIRTITYAPAGQSFQASIALEKFEAQSSSGVLGAGHPGAALLAGLLGLGLLRRRGR